MSSEFNIQVYRGPERAFHSTWPFLDMVRESLTALVGMSFWQVSIKVLIQAMPEDMFGAPPSEFVENLIPEYGYAEVLAYKGNQLVYEQPHLVSEIVTHTLASKLRAECPEEVSWAFRIDIPGMPEVSGMRPAPQVAGAIVVDPATQAGPQFTVRRLAEPELPLRSLRHDPGYQVVGEGDGPVTAVLSAALLEDMLTRPFSAATEDGGFLAGRAFRDADRHGSNIVELTTAEAARHSGASVMHFVFTGDSFAEIKRILRTDRPDERIVGWYHTHLFPATDSFGLSSFDVRMHLSTFTIPWQVAALINVDADSRVLRFYARDGDNMVLCPHGICG